MECDDYDWMVVCLRLRLICLFFSLFEIELAEFAKWYVWS